jgi:hypothetical protein
MVSPFDRQEEAPGLEVVFMEAAQALSAFQGVVSQQVASS